LYGGNLYPFLASLKRLGITTHFVTEVRPEAFEPLINERTRLIYLETVGNPKLEIPDFERISAIAHAHGIPVVVDNTFATPYLCRRSSSASILWSTLTTKWIGGMV